MHSDMSTFFNSKHIYNVIKDFYHFWSI